ncbi:MAG: hypothetical protein ACO3A2_03595, partial [Bdellovibrionia bacterium]
MCSTWSLIRKWLFFVGLVLLPMRAVLAEQPFNDNLVQPLELKGPTRGTIAGDLSSINFSALSGQAATGSFLLKLHLAMPKFRGTLIHDFTPRYSPSNGQSEWGMGFQSAISIYRFREQGGLDFESDTLMSPWGLLIRGATGDYYPKGLTERVRVRMLNSDELLAFLPDGSKLKFGGVSARIHSEGKGNYAWYVSEAESAIGLKAQYHYAANDSGALFLTEVLYAGFKETFQYRVSLSYEHLLIPTFDYRSGSKLKRDRRVIRVDVQSLGTDGRYAEVNHFILNYRDAPQSPRFFLVDIQKFLPSGDSEPPVHYSYNEGVKEILESHWEQLPYLDSLVEHRDALLSPDYSAQVDLKREGLASFETRIGFDLIHIAAGSYSVEPIQPRSKGQENDDSLCRPVGDSRRTPRQFIPIRGPNQDYESIDLYPNGNQTQLIACERHGHLKAKVRIEGSWDLGRFTRIIDLNHTGKPDLIKVYRGGYAVAPNASDESNPYQFGEVRTRRLFPEVNPLGFWVLDMNGDGIPDLVVKTQSGIFIWYGKGNFEFEQHGEFRSFKSALGRRIENLSEISLNFVDLNHDGLMDIFLTSKTNTQIFLNTGSGFVEQVLPNLQDKLGIIQSYPIIADLKGTGNTQIGIVQAGKAYSAELESPSSGLMVSADDGKGTTLQFNYRRAKAEPGIGQRLPLLSEVIVSVVGQKPIHTRHEYQNPKFHSNLGRLLGYELVTSYRGHATVHASYLQGDDYTGGLLSSTIEQDLKSQVSRFSRTNYNDIVFDGIPIKIVATLENGWIHGSHSLPVSMSDGASVSSTQIFENYNNKLCAIKIIKNSSSNTLVTETDYSELPEFSDHWICQPTQIKLSGTHTENTFDFNHQLKITRNEKGQPLQVIRSSNAGARAQDQIVQDLKYNLRGDLVALKMSGRGETRYNYDAAHRLTQVTHPDGKISTVIYDDIRDLPLSIRNFRGLAGSEWIEFFRFNALGLMSSQWSNLSGNEELPNVKYSYHFANSSNHSLAYIETNKRMNLGSSEREIWNQEIQFFTGGGTEIALAQKADSGFSVSGIKDLDPEIHRITQMGYKLLSHEKKHDLFTFNDLKMGAFELGHHVENSLGFLEQEQTAIQKGVFQLKDYLTEIESDGIASIRTENSIFKTTSVKDINGNVVRYKDESNQNYLFQYDALNRLRKIVLPEIQSGASSKNLVHKIQYDSFGNISLIYRDGVGSIGYQYEIETGLLKSKIYLDSRGLPIRTVVHTYDPIGRVIETTYQKSEPTDSPPETYLFTYDGNLADGRTVPGQFGFLSSTRGPGFYKNFKYRADEKVIEQQLYILGGPTWTTSYEYRPDGSISKKVTEIIETDLHKKSINSDFGVDDLGRPASLSINSHRLLEYKYNDYSEIERILFSNSDEQTHYTVHTNRAQGLARELELGYDEWTHDRNRISKSFTNSSKKFDTSWSINSRGLIEQEVVNGLTRSYVYSDPRGFLTSSYESGQTQEFEYDTVGLMTHVKNQSKTTEFIEEGGQLYFGKMRYVIDSSGRVSTAESGQFSYNGLGRLSEVVRFPKPVIEYGYDEQGIRLFKKVGGTIREVYQGDALYNGESIYEPLKVSGLLVDLLEDGKPMGITTDMRGSVVLDGLGKLNLPTTYGERIHRDKTSRVADFAFQGFDEDLGAYRMAHRDYDPALKRFLTPDPLLLENPEHCLE